MTPSNAFCIPSCLKSSAAYSSLKAAPLGTGVHFMPRLAAWPVGAVGCMFAVVGSLVVGQLEMFKDTLLQSFLHSVFS